MIPLALFSGAATAANLTCTVPAENVARTIEICEELRIELRQRVGDWSNNKCASQLLRVGLFAEDRRMAKNSARVISRESIATAVNDFQSTWLSPEPAACGDLIVDFEFGETCDDGNTENGDGCSNACGIE